MYTDVTQTLKQRNQLKYAIVSHEQQAVVVFKNLSKNSFLNLPTAIWTVVDQKHACAVTEKPILLNKKLIFPWIVLLPRWV